MSGERLFPIMGKRIGSRLPGIPWRLLEPHAAMALRNHSQTLERLAERGGLSPSEALHILRGVSWSHRSQESARLQALSYEEADRELRALVAERTP